MKYSYQLQDFVFFLRCPRRLRRLRSARSSRPSTWRRWGACWKTVVGKMVFRANSTKKHVEFMGFWADLGLGPIRAGIGFVVHPWIEAIVHSISEVAHCWLGKGALKSRGLWWSVVLVVSLGAWIWSLFILFLARLASDHTFHTFRCSRCSSLTH